MEACFTFREKVNQQETSWNEKALCLSREPLCLKKRIAYRVYNPSGSDFSRHGRFDDLSDRTGRTKQYLFRWICHTDKEIRVLRAAIAWIRPDSFLLRELPGNWPKFGIVFPLASHQFLECLLKKVRRNEIGLWHRHKAFPWLDEVRSPGHSSIQGQLSFQKHRQP